eukprot:m.126074 g.126074  ORF g.126074 m.126074 type:complete len:264 (+) comp29175_c4_seq1:178-969(+)
MASTDDQYESMAKEVIALEKSLHMWAMTSDMTPEFVEECSQSAIDGNGWMRTMLFMGGDNGREQLLLMGQESSIIAALLLSVTVPMATAPPECVADNSASSIVFSISASLAVALYMYAVALCGVLNGNIAATVRNKDMCSIAKIHDNVPGLSVMSISVANYMVIIAVTCAMYNCYEFEWAAFIYFPVNFFFACSSLYINSKIRKSAHSVNIPVKELEFPLAEVKAMAAKIGPFWKQKQLGAAQQSPTVSKHEGNDMSATNFGF